MTSCDNVHTLISGWLDGELANEEKRAVELHLETCEDCREELVLWRQMDKQLGGALIIGDIQTKVDRIENHMQSKALRASESSLNHRIRWIMLLAAAASAAFLASQLMRGFRSKEQLEIAATLVKATGPVQLLTNGDAIWNTIQNPDRSELAIGVKIRTPKHSLCELTTSSRCEVRINENSEVVVSSPTRFELLRGKLWCRVPHDGQMIVSMPVKDETSLLSSGTATFQCETNGEFASCSPCIAGTQLPELRVGGRILTAEVGETLIVEDKNQVSRNGTGDSIEVWQLPLLALSGDSRDELRRRLRQWLAPIGRVKVRHMNETQIRDLGPGRCHSIVGVRYRRTGFRAQATSPHRPLACR